MLFFFFFNDTATTEIYTLSLHDALPILLRVIGRSAYRNNAIRAGHSPILPVSGIRNASRDRKSTRLNSSHGYISYAVFCLKKKKQDDATHHTAGTQRHSVYDPSTPML